MTRVILGTTLLFHRHGYSKSFVALLPEFIDANLFHSRTLVAAIFAGKKGEKKNSSNVRHVVRSEYICFGARLAVRKSSAIMQKNANCLGIKLVGTHTSRRKEAYSSMRRSTDFRII